MIKHLKKHRGKGRCGWRNSAWVAGAAAVAFGVFLTGCTTTGDAREAHQFEPVPPRAVDAAELEPVAPPSMTDLLETAEEAFNAANEAQEKGDHETALRQYALMLELLIEADLDPAIFYNLRNEFQTILSSTSQQAKLYERMRPAIEGQLAYGAGAKVDLPIEFPLHKRVLIEIEEIQKVYPKNFQNGLNRSGKYAPYIRAELAKAGLPEDLVWLAMVESQFTPKIMSRAGAGGMWQFMRTTGRRYGLRIDPYGQCVDERFHWQKATAAAIAYLSDLYELFGSWPLAISAYNRGEGGIERAIAANGGERDLWALLDTPPAAYHIPRETKKFYAKLLASTIVARNPERYGFTYDPQQGDNCVEVPVKGPYALSDLDQACGFAKGTLARLNPHLIRGETPSEEYGLFIPADARTKFAAAVKKTSKLQYAAGAGGVHVVRRGETISHIAQRYHVSSRELMRINRIRSARHLQVGQKLVIPGLVAGGGGPSGGGSYRVKSGDTLYDIAKAEKVTVADLQRWNNLGKRSRIHVGQTLYVSDPATAKAAAATPAPAKGEKLTHVVQAGEYPAKIARKYGANLDDFLRWNNLTKSSMIRIGDKLVVYGNGHSEPAGEPAKTASKSGGSQQETGKGKQPSGTKRSVHKVAKNESASVIAARYGVRTSDLLTWNGLTRKSILRVGDECVVYVPIEEGEKPAAAEPDEATPESSERIVHIVAKGQNPTTIARRYGVRLSDLFEWNGWKKNHVLHIGDEVVIQRKPKQ